MVQSREGQSTAPADAESVEGKQVLSEPHSDGPETGGAHTHELCVLCEGFLVYYGAGCCEGGYTMYMYVQCIY